ncbi:MAG: T9SS type A sorting domain-containing protein [Saprospiraceae bacterium]|nr:MAG: T9SS type A sorting domain-containing protein [Saprospiraceae bacterium]
MEIALDHPLSFIAQLYEANDTIFEVLQSNRLALADSLLDLNDAINAVEVFELNEKKVFDIFLNTIGKGNTSAAVAQLDTLESIASQCPEEGGRGVLEAINLYQALTNIGLYIMECSLKERAEKKQTLYANNKFGLYPNPAVSTCNAAYNLEKGQTGELSVWDAFGKQVAWYYIKAENGVVQINNLPSGIYFVHLSVNGRILQTEKFVKL